MANEFQNGILSGADLLTEIFGAKDSLIEDIDCERFVGWQFDLNLGDEAFVTDSDKPIGFNDNDLLMLGPVHCLIVTQETVNMPNYLMGFIAEIHI